MFAALPDEDRLLDLLAETLDRLPPTIDGLSLVDAGQGPLATPTPHAGGHLHAFPRAGRILSEAANEAGRIAPVSALLRRDGHATLQAGDRLAVRQPPLLRARHRLQAVLEALPETANLRLGGSVPLPPHARLAQAAILARSPTLAAFAEQRRAAPIRLRRQGQAVAFPPLWTLASAWRLSVPRILR